jgi:hypothetical protein
MFLHKRRNVETLSTKNSYFSSHVLLRDGRGILLQLSESYSEESFPDWHVSVPKKLISRRNETSDWDREKIKTFPWKVLMPKLMLRLIKRNEENAISCANSFFWAKNNNFWIGNLMISFLESYIRINLDKSPAIWLRVALFLRGEKQHFPDWQ